MGVGYEWSVGSGVGKKKMKKNGRNGGVDHVRVGGRRNKKRKKNHEEWRWGAIRRGV